MNYVHKTNPADWAMADPDLQDDMRWPADPMIPWTAPPVPPIRNTLTSDPAGRKQIPIHTTLFKYFPMAMAEVAECCVIGGQQHGQSVDQLFWDRAKSGRELDALCRHLLDAGYRDTDGVRHSAKIVFRALANLEIELEQ